MEYQQYFSCCFMFAHMHSSCCLDYDPYPFCGGDCLDPCILEWSHYFGGDGLELDAGVVSINDVMCTQSQIAAISKSVPSVQGRLSMHSIGSVLATRLVPACLRILASVTGQIISMSLAMGPVARLRH